MLADEILTSAYHFRNRAIAPIREILNRQLKASVLVLVVARQAMLVIRPERAF
jgi:hypothetical protein